MVRMSAMARSPHPLVPLMEQRGWDRDDVCRRLARRGRQTSSEYLRHILARRKRPSFDFASDLAAVFSNEVTAQLLQEAGPMPEPKRSAA